MVSGPFVNEGQLCLWSNPSCETISCDANPILGKEIVIKSLTSIDSLKASNPPNLLSAIDDQSLPHVA